MIRVWESKPKHDGIDGKRVPGVHDGLPTPDPSQRTGWRLTATSDTPTPRHTDSHLGIVGLGFQAVSATPYLENWGCSRLRLTENQGKLQNFRKFFGLSSELGKNIVGTLVKFVYILTQFVEILSDFRRRWSKICRNFV